MIVIERELRGGHKLDLWKEEGKWTRKSGDVKARGTW